MDELLHTGHEEAQESGLSLAPLRARLTGGADALRARLAVLEASPAPGTDVRKLDTCLPVVCAFQNWISGHYHRAAGFIIVNPLYMKHVRTAFAVRRIGFLYKSARNIIGNNFRRDGNQISIRHPAGRFVV